MSASSENSLRGSVAAYVLGDAEVDPVACELRVSGKAVPLEPKAFDLLLYLIRHRERVVGMDDLLRNVWPDVRVSSSVVRRCVVLVRRALADAKLDDPIKTVSRRGYRFVGHVTERPPDPPGGRFSSSSPGAKRSLARASVIGRAREFAQLLQALGAAAAGSGSVSVLAGEAGIGKSHIARAIAVEAEGRGALVLAGRAHEGGGAPAFWPWTQVFRAYLAKHRDRAEALVEIDPLLVSIVPELRRAVDERGKESNESLERDRFQLFDAVARALRQIAEETPTLVLLEDLHWADTATIELVRFLVPVVRTARLLVVATIRDEVWGRGHPLEQPFRALSGDPACEFLRLGGLLETDLGELLEVQLGRMPPAEWLRAVWEKTGGNPFFAREIAVLLAHEEEVQAGSQRTPFRIPDRVRDALLRRVAPLPSESREALDTAALMGVAFEVPILAAVMERSVEEVLRRLAPAEADGIVVEADGGRGTYRFSHALVPETLRSNLTGMVRLPIHRRIAEVLVTRGEAEIDAHLDEIAHHYVQAASLGVAEEAKQYVERAGDRAMELFGYEKAESMYELALSLLERYAPDALEARAELLMKQARAALSRGGSRVEIRAMVRRAVDLAERAGAFRLLATAAMAYAGDSEFMEPFTRMAPGFTDEARSVLLRALARCPTSESRTRAKLLASLAGTSLGTIPLAESLALVQEATEISQRSGDSQLEAELLAAEVYVRVEEPQMLSHRKQLIERAIDLARGGSPAWIRDMHGMRAGLLAELGRFAEADRAMEVFEADAATRRKPLSRAPLLAWRSMRAGMEGRFALARELSREFEETASGVLTGIEEIAFAQRGKLAFLDGYFHHLDGNFAGRGNARYAPAWVAGQAKLALAQGRIDEAIARLRELSKDDFGRVPGEVWIPTMATIAEVASEVGDRLVARALYERLLPFSGRFIVLGNLIACDGSIDLVLGRLAAHLGERDEASRHLASALEAHLRVGAHPWVAFTEVEIARGLLARGERGRAEELVERARQTALFLDMPALLARIDGLTRD